jgi:hypothetical protein
MENLFTVHKAGNNKVYIHVLKSRSAIYIHDNYVKTLLVLFPSAEPGQLDIQQDGAEGLAFQTHQMWEEG